MRKSTVEVFVDVLNVLGLECQQGYCRHLFPHSPKAKESQEPSHGITCCFPCCVGGPILCRVLLGLVGDEFVDHVVHAFPFLLVALIAKLGRIRGNPVDNVGGRCGCGGGCIGGGCGSSSSGGKWSNCWYGREASLCWSRSGGGVVGEFVRLEIGWKW